MVEVGVAVRLLKTAQEAGSTVKATVKVEVAPLTSVAVQALWPLPPVGVNVGVVAEGETGKEPEV